jgi:hypothetical protein
MTLIRTATQEDASSISRVHVESWQTTYRGILPEAFLASLNAEESMAAWVLEANASTRFYERSGANRVSMKEIDIGGSLLPLVAYGWPSLKSIIAQNPNHTSV